MLAPCLSLSNLDMVKKTKRPQSKQTWYKKWQFWATVGIVVAAGLLLWFWRRSAPPPLPDDYQAGSVTYCLAGPAFTAELGFENPAIDTSQVLATGLVIRESDDLTLFYQHETWDDAGHVGPFAYDNAGTIYVGPTPLASLQTNPTAEQNWIYAVDSQTAVMAKYLELPWPGSTQSGNPYGVSGLTYDYDTHSLYAASIAGSTAQEELGGIYQIDLETGEIVSQLNGRDLIGIGVFNGTKVITNPPGG